jgi:hypothetical protein
MDESSLLDVMPALFDKSTAGATFGFAAAGPLTQINLLPDLTQVNFLPLAIFVRPDLEQVPPAFGVAAFNGVARDSRSTTATPIPSCRRMV